MATYKKTTYVREDGRTTFTLPSGAQYTSMGIKYPAVIATALDASIHLTGQDARALIALLGMV